MTTVRWIAHKGMAQGRPGGTPTRQTIQKAIDLKTDLIEVDVQITKDGVLVIRHDPQVGRSKQIAKMTYQQLKLADPVVMTIDELDRFVDGRSRLLLDMKGHGIAESLADWLALQPHPERYAVCGGLLTDFKVLLEKAPKVDRWPTFPELDTDFRTAFRRVVGALAHRRENGETTQMARDVGRALRDIVRDRNAAITTIGGMPWRDGLPRELPDLLAAVQPTGISVHQWLVTPALVDAAHELGITVTAWTVDRPDALAAVVRAGVDYVTSNDPEAMRRALPRARFMYPPVLGERPDAPPLPKPGDDAPPDREVA